MDVEALVCDALRDGLDGVHVATRVPRDIPEDGCVFVQRVGGPRRDLVTDMPIVTVQTYGPSSVEAAALGEQCRRIVARLRFDDDRVRHVRETGGLVNFPDLEASRDRYQFTVQLNVRSEAFEEQP